MKTKTLFHLLALLLMISTAKVFGQTVHYTGSSTNFQFNSSVTVSSYISTDCYLIGATDAAEIFIGKLDNNFPQAYTGTPRLFQLSVTGGMFLNGGFFDEDDNIVVYGFQKTNNRGFIAKLTMSSGIATSVVYSVSTHNNTSVTDGCYSRSGSNKTYSFIINGNRFMRVPASLSGAIPANIVKEVPTGAASMSVSWDSYSSRHVLSGLSSTNFNFITSFPGNASIPNTPTFFTFQPPINFTSSEYTNRHVLSGNEYYSDSIAYLVQDLRDFNPPYTDLLWVMKVNYVTGAVLGQNTYRFDPVKMLILDVAHKFANLFVLGTHITSSNQIYRFLTEIDLADSSVFATKHLKDYDLQSVIPSMGTVYATTQGLYNNLIFNQANYFVQAAGALDTTNYMVEAFDLPNGTCDSLINNYLETIQYTNSTATLFFGSNLTLASVWVNSGTSFPSSTSTTFSTPSVTLTDNCLSENFHSAEEKKQTIKDKIEKKRQKHLPKEIPSAVGKITLTDSREFMVEGFEGTCAYAIYDINGKLLLSGKTFSGNKNLIQIGTAGMYFIKVTDSKDNVLSQKMVLQ